MAAGIQKPEDRRSVNVDERLYGVSETRLLSGQIVYNAPWLDVKLLGSKQHDSLLYSYDFDGSTEPLVSFDVPGHPADIKQAELQLISNDSSPYAEWLDVTGGVFYFHNIQGFNPVEVTVANLNPLNPDNLFTRTGITLPDALSNSLTDFFGLLNQLSGGNLPQGRLYRVRAQAQVKTESLGYYL